MVSKHHHQQLDVGSHSGIPIEDNEDNEDDITSKKDLYCMFPEQSLLHVPRADIKTGSR